MNRAAFRGRFPAGLLGAVAIAAIVELWLSKHEWDFCTPEAAVSRLAAIASRAEAARSGVLCLGDSQIKLGIAPGVVADRTGLTSYNLALYGAQPILPYYLLKHALDAGARPAAIILDGKPSVLMTDPRNDQQRHLAEVATFGDCVDIAARLKDLDFSGSVLAAKFVPSCRMRHEIRFAVREILRAKPWSGRIRSLAVMSNAKLNSGAVQLPALATDHGVLDQKDEWIYYYPHWVCRQPNWNYLRSLLKLAESRAIPVFWVVPPLAPEVIAKRESLGLDQRYTEFLERLSRIHRGIVILDARRSDYPANVFADAGHLNLKGAAALSADVGDVVARRLGGARDQPRWVTLPAFFERPRNAAIEDVQTTLARIIKNGSLVR